MTVAAADAAIAAAPNNRKITDAKLAFGLHWQVMLSFSNANIGYFLLPFLIYDVAAEATKIG